jgi:hypothetical protein
MFITAPDCAHLAGCQLINQQRTLGFSSQRPGRPKQLTLGLPRAGDDCDLSAYDQGWGNRDRRRRQHWGTHIAARYSRWPGRTGCRSKTDPLCFERLREHVRLNPTLAAQIILVQAMLIGERKAMLVETIAFSRPLDTPNDARRTIAEPTIPRCPATQTRLLVISTFAKYAAPSRTRKKSRFRKNSRKRARYRNSDHVISKGDRRATVDELQRKEHQLTSSAPC